MQSRAARASFIGREREFDRLVTSLDAACAGNGGVALIEGEPGIGKTRLLEEVAASARARDALVLWSRCYDGAGAPSLWPWRQAIRAYLEGRDPAALRTTIGAEAPVIAQVVAEMRALLPDLPLPPPLEGDEARFRFFESVGTFLRRAAVAQPLVLILDDLHWADASSLLLLDFLGQGIGDARVFLLGAYREAEPESDDALALALASLHRAANHQRLHLAGLSREQVGRIVQESAGRDLTGGDAALIAALHEETEGNPFFLLETLRHLVESGRVVEQDGRWQALGRPIGQIGLPSGVRDVIGRRLVRLTDGCHRLLTLAAVIGRQFDALTLERAARNGSSAETGEAVLDLLVEAESARMIAPLAGTSGHYRFAHALIRETLYDALTAPERSRLHRRVGEAIEAAHGSSPEARLAELAQHFGEAAHGGDVAKAIAYARRVAERAAAAFAHEDAVRQYEAALRLLPLLPVPDDALRIELILALGEALIPAGEPHRVADQIAPEALTVAEALGNRQYAARACRLAIEALLGYGAASVTNTAGFRHWAEQADRHAAPDTSERVLADLALAYVSFATGRPAEAGVLRRRALALARALDRPELLFRVVRDILANGPPPERETESLTLAEEFMARPRQGVNRQTMSRVLWYSGRVLLNWGQRERAESIWREVEESGGRARDAAIPLYSLIGEGTLAVLDGRLEAAIEAAMRLVARAEDVGSPVWGRQFASSLTLRPLLHLGRADEALVAVSQTAQLAGLEDPYWTAPRRALCLVQLGRQAEAERALHQFLARSDINNASDATSLADLAMLLEAAVLVQDYKTVAVLARRLADTSTMATAYWSFSCVARHLGTAAALLGDRSAARRYFEQAWHVAGTIRFRPELALTRLQLAELMAEHYPRERSEAEALLDFAIAEFHAMRMKPALERALGFRDTFRATTRCDRGAAYPDGLTSREVEVLRLAAGGLSNPEIADTLVLSVKTVERHLANVYAKIGARNRVEATAYAARKGLL